MFRFLGCIICFLYIFLSYYTYVAFYPQMSPEVHLHITTLFVCTARAGYVYGALVNKNHIRASAAVPNHLKLM